MEKTNFIYDVYMLCPVRGATKEEKTLLKRHKKLLEDYGFKVLYPAEDTNQDDSSGGYRICKDHCFEILNSRAVHIYWNEKSTGSKVDLGTSLGEHHRRGLDVMLINREYVESLVEEQKKNGISKSYERVLLTLDDLADSDTRIF